MKVPRFHALCPQCRGDQMLAYYHFETGVRTEEPCDFCQGEGHVSFARADTYQAPANVMMDLTLTATRRCKECHGKGVEFVPRTVIYERTYFVPHICEECHGTGEVNAPNVALCDVCHGTGEADLASLDTTGFCAPCDGIGYKTRRG
jgi:DnaJ-class molecular chaperone